MDCENRLLNGLYYVEWDVRPLHYYYCVPDKICALFSFETSVIKFETLKHVVRNDLNSWTFTYFR